MNLFEVWPFFVLISSLFLECPAFYYSVDSLLHLGNPPFFVMQNKAASDYALFEFGDFLRSCV